MKQIRLYIRTLLILLLMFLGGTINNAWASQITYHILTLPMQHRDVVPDVDGWVGNTIEGLNGYRQEAIRVVVTGSNVELPAYLKSPLAKNFTYYQADFVAKKSNTAEKIYQYNNDTKTLLYSTPIAPYTKVTKSGGSITEVASNKTEWETHEGGTQKTATSLSDYNTQKSELADGTYYFKMNCLSEYDPVTSNCDIYVTYEYDPDNTIAKLDGSVSYNIKLGSGFLALNRGRNNRLAHIPESYVLSHPEYLTSEDFVKIDDKSPTNQQLLGNTGVQGYWKDDPYNVRSEIEFQFHFLFKYYGLDPYNISIYTAYDKDDNYIEKVGSSGPFKKWYKGSSLFANGANNAYLASDDNKQYNSLTEVSSTPNYGYYHAVGTVRNSFAILYATDKNGIVNMDKVVFLCSRIGDGKLYYLNSKDNGNNIYIVEKAKESAPTFDKDMYEVKTVNFKVTTPFYDNEGTDEQKAAHTLTASVQMSEYTLKNNDIVEGDIPTSLKRKNCTFNGNYYKDAAHTQKITKYSDLTTEPYDIYVDYEVNEEKLGFKAIKPAATYSDETWKTATWYELTDKDETADKKIQWNSSSSKFQNNGASATYDKKSEFAFIGDPYELQVISRSQTSGAIPYYVGATDPTPPATETALTTSTTASEGYLWELPDDATDGSFLLRKYKSDGHWYWNTEGTDQNVAYSTENSTRLKVLELPKYTYTYNIVDMAGNIAIQGTASQTIFSPLGKSSIPSEIFSPFLNDEDVTFYSTYSASTCSGPMEETTATAGDDIYVKYTNTHLSGKNIKLNNVQQFNVKLNNVYIYYDTSESKILNNETLPTVEEDLEYFLWRLEGEDPYAMKIYNVGKKQYVKVAGWANEQVLGFDATIGNASRFIAMLGNYQGIYEVLAATGNTDYYHIGRSGEETKIYDVATYHPGTDELRFELADKEPIYYTLIDKAGEVLFTVSSNNPRLTLPADFVSPLVDTYYYYPTKAKALVDNHTDNILEIEYDTNENDLGGENKDSHVYVTYTVNNRVKFNDNASPYLLKFLDPNIPKYNLEDGNDKLTTDEIQPVYPYTNGDGSLNIYGQAMNEEQMNGGANTRPRWVWFFESEKDDPYHVKIHSKSTISYNSVSHPTYLQTYAVHFKQDADENTKHIVTGGILPGIASVDPTEYMILGLPGKYKLLTTHEIEGARRTVNSLEQYWKTYNMIKLHLLGIPKSADAFSNDESTWVMPTTNDPATLADENIYRTTIEARGWHSYEVIANAVRWNGYNDKKDGHEKKVVEKLEHWFQTFDMGDGTFDIENANIPPVLVLLDRHGWEIMRKPLPTTTYPNGDELEALKVYDSPMVKEYKFYSNATKATGCHKYTLRMQNGAERDQIKYGGKHYTSTSLADLPPISATGVKDNTGVLQDQYVTYTVKDEYENSYQYNLELHEDDQTFVESGTPSKFLILQNQRFARDNGSDNSYLSKPIFEGTNPYDPNANAYDMILSPSQTQVANQSTNVDTNKDGIIDDINLWYVQPNLNIDKEMGIKWAGAAGGSSEPLTEYETKKAYKDKTGFDPYNIQLKNAYNDKYLTSHMTTTSLNNGIMVGGYDGGNNSVTLSTWVDVKDNDTYTPNGNEGYDHTYIQLTNQTFMAVQDDNGNMQLMPRFDHTKRMNVVNSGGDSHTTLQDPVPHAKASVEDDSSMGSQTVFMVRPQVFEYHIIDHQGREALRYKTTGEYSPAIKEHFKSPLATDFKFYFDHAAYSTSTSNKASYDAVATSSTYFQKTVDDETAMATAAKALTVVDDYYFRIGTSTYTYKKVTVTKGYVAGPPATDATYTTTNCTEAEWTNAVAYQRSADNEAAMQTAVVSLAEKGLYYYQLGTYKYYQKVTVSGETKTIEDSDKSAYDAAGGSQRTATDASDFTTKVKALGDGTYYYEIGPLHSYQKVIVTSVNGSSSLTADVAAHKDISDREITGSFADAGLNGLKNQVYVRYSYDEEADVNQILQGKWFTMKLADKEAGVVADGTLDAADGTGVSLRQGTSKPNPVDGTTDANKAWQWKFLAEPTDAANVDPYAVKIYNRSMNYDAAKRNVGIKVNDFDRFALLNHSSENDYALAVAGVDLADYTYTFLNGASMTTSNGATTVKETNQFTVADDAAYEGARNDLTANGVYYFKLTSHDESSYSNYGSYMKVTVTSGPSRAEEESTEADWSNALAYYNNSNQYHFTIKSNALSDDSKLILIDDVVHEYNYKVINNYDSGNILAISGTQTTAEAVQHNYTPYLPVTIQTPLLNDDDYLYYEKAATTDNKGNDDPSDDSYTFTDIPQLTTLCGLYDDEVYVRYKAYDMDKTKYEVPNKKALVDGKVAKHSESKDVALNINAGLPYDIIWENDNMMRSNDDSNSDADGIYIKGKAGQILQSDTENNGYVWKFQGNDPYALKIYNTKQAKYIHAVSADNDAACTLTSEATPFMLLKRADYEYGVLEMTGHKGSKLTMTDDNGSTLGVAKITTGNPKYFIIFGLSTHRLIYHLAIAKIGDTVEIPYSDSNYPRDSRYTVGSNKLVIDGTTQRDLSETYQLGETIFGKTYSVNAGEVSIGDVLKVPTEFERPNCIYFYYVDNIQTAGLTATYQKTANDNTAYESERDKLSSTGYYYFKIGTSTYTYKRVHVTSTSPSLEYSEVDCTADDWSNCWQDNDELNTLYKGLEVTKLMSEARLIGGLVQINVGYAFQTGLETNAGEGFVTNLNQNLWYTFETQDGAKPFLAHYTNAWGLQAMEGRDTRYTNDYLWCPLGDVYGFKMYNRYMVKNSGGVNNVMTMSTMTEGTNLKLGLPGTDGPTGYEVFELLGSNNPGYFRIHPVINHSGTQYYIWKDPADNYAKLSTNYSEWTFALTSELLKPYVDRVGYVGGLKETIYTANKAVMDKVKNGTASYADMLTIQGIVYNDANIVSYTPGYYRLHSQPGVSGISPVRYASGYLHDIEKTAVSGGIPMHFYSKAGVTTTFEGLNKGFTSTNATRGEIPVPATEYDPSTIFYFPDNGEKAGNPRSTMRTQGLYVAANANGDAANGTTTNRLQRAVMKAIDPEDVETQAITFSLMDIGGAVLLIHNGAEPRERIYLNFDQSNCFQRTASSDDDMNNQANKFTSEGTYYFKIGSSTYKKLTVTTGYVAGPPATNAVYAAAISSTSDEWNKAADIYDLKYYHESPTDDAKWCMQPVQKSGTAGTNEMGLTIATNNGGDDYYYTTFCAPFDVLLPEDDKGVLKYDAYTCDTWNDAGLNPTKVPKVGETYAAGRFVPAGTPVIIRTTDNSGNIKLALPSNSPSSAESCIFTGKYLEQLLGDGSNVYTLGLPFISNVTENASTGEISAELPEQAKSGVGFYINANPYKEHNALQSMWLRNNRYVLHNKIYYRATGPGAPQMSLEFVPVIFDDGEQPEDEELQPDGSWMSSGDGCIYDLLGRKVATKEQVTDGSWRERLSPGIYILNGRKFKM